MKVTVVLALLSLLAGSLSAGLNITASDIQEDSEGYYYEYELTYEDMYNSSKFVNDVMFYSHVSVVTPASRLPRNIAADAGANGAELIYKFDFSGVTMPDGSRLFINHIDIRDLITLSNASGKEDTDAGSGWNTSSDLFSYNTITLASTPASGIETFPGSAYQSVAGIKQQLFYRVEFRNTTLNGFDSNGNLWNSQSNMSTDGFRVRIDLSATAPAGTYAGGIGTDSDPYEIATVGQLEALGENPFDWDKSFELISDIDMGGTIYDESIIGYMFTGSFDGKGHTISNLKIFNLRIDSIRNGLFYVIGSEGCVSNLNIENAKMSSKTGIVGAITSSNWGTIDNCTVSGEFRGNTLVGAIAGRSTGQILNSKSNSTCFGIYIAGGITADNGSAGRIENCSSSGIVFSTGDALNNSAGGIVGLNYGVINGCDSNAFIMAKRLGGVSAVNEGGGVISNCYANCKQILIGDDNAIAMGGLVGANSGELRDCYAVADMLDTIDGYVGGLVGNEESDTSVYTACFWDSDVAGLVASGGVGNLDSDPAGVYDRNTLAMKSRSTFTAYGWDFAGETVNGTEDIWEIVEGETYPRFVGECIDRFAGDINGDCAVNMLDFAELAKDWLECGKITPELCP